MSDLQFNSPEGIRFNSVKQPKYIFKDGPIGRQNRISTNGDNVTNVDETKPFINAVDIDWNGAELGNDVINTTGDLLNYIQQSSSNQGNSSQPYALIQKSYFRWYVNGITPLTPVYQGGSVVPREFVNDSEHALPQYWNRNAINRPSDNWILWMCFLTVKIDTSGNELEVVSISTPMQISGTTGSPGEDGNKREYIYKNSNQELDFENIGPQTWAISQQDDYTGPIGQSWSDNPQGVTEEFPYEYVSYRDKVSGEWGAFSTPVIWSHYGQRGIDGDGVEYVYVRTTVNQAPTIINEAGEYQRDEYCPIASIGNNMGAIIGDENDVEFNNVRNQARCTDNPKGVDSIYRYEWVATRKKQNGEWQEWSTGNTMKAWAVHGSGDRVTIEDGCLKINDICVATIEGANGAGLEIPHLNNLTDPPANGALPMGYYNGAVYIWDSSRGEWITLGQYEGSGTWFHIAYAQDLVINNGEVTEIKGFTVQSGATNLKWRGLCFTNIEQDPEPERGTIGFGVASAPTDTSDLQIINKYHWNIDRGLDGNGREYVFFYTSEAPISNGEITCPFVLDDSLNYNNKSKDDDEYLPIISTLEGGVVTRVSNSNANNFGKIKGNIITYNSQQYKTCYDDPPHNTGVLWKYLWVSNRKKINGTWGSFSTPILFNYDNTLYDLVCDTSAVKNSDEYTPDSVTFTQTKNGIVCQDHYMRYSIDNGNFQNITNKVSDVTFYFPSQNNISRNDLISPTETLIVQLIDDLNNPKILRSVTIVFNSDGTYSYTKEIYKWFANSVTDQDLETVGYRPSNEISPEGWSTSMDISNTLGSGARLIMWQSEIINGEFSGEWVGPFDVTDGVDSSKYEFVYKRFENTPTQLQLNSVNSSSPDQQSPAQSPSEDDFIPSGWTDNPQGVGLSNGVTYKYEYVAIRIKKNGFWQQFSDPIPWSVLGEKGRDGDGYEYIYKLSDSDPGTPVAKYGDNRDEDIPDGWTDDPQGVSSTTGQTKEWVSTRRKTNGTWGAYSPAALWTQYVPPGTAGKNGQYTQYAYKNDTSRPSTPTSSSTYPPSGWTSSPSTPDFVNGYYTWCTTRTITYDASNNVSYGTWNTPYRITGDNGQSGEDGKYVEFIYRKFDSKNITWPGSSASNKNLNPANWNISTGSDRYGNVFQDPDYQGPSVSDPRSNSNYWNDNPSGVTEEYKYEYMSQREYNGTSFSSFSAPVLWSTYGEKGQDGDGVEYIFKHFTSEQSFGNNNNNPAYWNAEQSNQYLGPSGYQWAADPQGIDANYKFEYYAMRTKKLDTSDNIVKWGAYTTPKLWTKWVKDGQSSFTSTVFCRTNEEPAAPVSTLGTFNAPNPPDSSWKVYKKSNSSQEISGKYWNDGIPSGEGILWESRRTFTSDGASPQDSTWSPPRKVQDTQTYDVEFALEQSGGSQPAPPDDNNRHGGSSTQIWFDPILDKYEQYTDEQHNTPRDFNQMVWRAEREINNGTPSAWVITRIKGEGGKYEVSLDESFKATTSSDNPGNGWNQTTGNRTSGWSSSSSSWNETNRYLWCQEKRNWSDNTATYGNTYLKGVWGEAVAGEDAYSFVITPASIILTQNINDTSDYGLPKTFNISVQKGSTPKSFVVSSPSTGLSGITVTRDSSSSSTSHTITLSSITNTSTTSFEISVTLSSIDGMGSNTKTLKIPVYINRVGTWKQTIENGISTEMGDKIVYELGDNGVIKTAYDAAITKSAQGLTQEFTEEISKALGTGGRNLFGFHKGCLITDSPWPSVPFIQGYGVIVNQKQNDGSNTRKRAMISSLGLNGIGGSFVVSFMAKVSSGSGSMYVNICDVYGRVLTSSVLSDVDKSYVSLNTTWRTFTMLFNIETISGNKDFIVFGDNTGDIGNNNIYIRHLKIERGDEATEFVEADEDISYTGRSQMLGSLTLKSGVSTNISYSDGKGVTKTCNRYYYSGSLSSTPEWDETILANVTQDLVEGHVYTLSFWATSYNINSYVPNIHILFSLLNGSVIITDMGSEQYDEGRGGINEGASSYGLTLITLKHYEWVHYFVRFYVANTVSAADISRLVALTIYKGYNSSWYGYIYMTDIVLQEGYVMEPTRYSSLMEQSARRISLSVSDGLNKTGIDIEAGKITAKTDNFEIKNNNGDTTFSVDEEGNIIGSGNASFAGTISSKGVIQGANTYRAACFHGRYVPNFDSSGNVTYDLCYYCFRTAENVPPQQAYNNLPNKTFNSGEYYFGSEIGKYDFSGKVGSNNVSLVHNDLDWYIDDNNSSYRQYCYFIECSGPSDILVFSFQNGSNYVQQPVTLPRACDYKGKILDIHISNITTGSSVYFQSVDYNFSSNKQNQCFYKFGLVFGGSPSISPGSTGLQYNMELSSNGFYQLMSIYYGSNWIWVLI